MKQFKTNMSIIVFFTVLSIVVTTIRNYNFDPKKYILIKGKINDVKCGIKSGCEFKVSFIYQNTIKNLRIYRSGAYIHGLEKAKGDSCIIAYDKMNEIESDVVVTRSDYKRYKNCKWYESYIREVAETIKPKSDIYADSTFGRLVNSMLLKFKKNKVRGNKRIDTSKWINAIDSVNTIRFVGKIFNESVYIFDTLKMTVVFHCGNILLYDKGNKLVLFLSFFKGLYAKNTNADDLLAIFVLDNKLMPIYGLKREFPVVDKPEIYSEKYDYNSQERDLIGLYYKDLFTCSGVDLMGYSYAYILERVQALKNGEFSCSGKFSLNDGGAFKYKPLYTNQGYCFPLIK